MHISLWTAVMVIALGAARFLPPGACRLCPLPPSRSTICPSPAAVGKHAYLNMGVTILDDSQVTIGDRVLMGPNVKVGSRAGQSRRKKHVWVQLGGTVGGTLPPSMLWPYPNVPPHPATSPNFHE